jgi:hypothetical protein
VSGLARDFHAFDLRLLSRAAASFTTFHIPRRINSICLVNPAILARSRATIRLGDNHIFLLIA